MQRADFSCLAERLKSVSVMKFDTMRCRNRDDSVTPEARQNAAHGLDRQSEVIGDVTARHRQIEHTRCILPFRDLQEKARDALGSGHPPEHQHARMCVSKLAERSVVQATYQQGVLVDQPIGGALGISRDGDIPDGFRRSDPDAGSREAEAVAGETEFGDMTAAIGQQFADPHPRPPARVLDEFDVSGCSKLLSSPPARCAYMRLSFPWGSQGP